VEDAAPQPADDVLVDATLARIARSESERVERMRLTRGEGAAGGRRIRLPDFVSVAAVILIAVGVLWPVLGHVRQRAIDAGCVANLTALGSAFQTYAQDFEGAVPMQTAGWGAGVVQPRWLDPEALVRLGYCDAGHLNCPGHRRAGEAGYSRQLVISGDGAPMLTAGARPVVGDRNPLIDAMILASRGMVDPRANSESHSKRGQNVLSTDASVSWLTEPIVGGDDNIWLIQGQREPVRDLVPATDADVFLVQ
jgi:hypothetical protein